MLIAASLLLMVVAPGVAAASEGDAPLSEVPERYQPMVEAAAEELGVPADELRSASRDDLQALVCDELESRSTSGLVADVEAALEAAPPKEYRKLSEAEREQLVSQLPTLIGQLEGEYCETSADASTDDGDDEDEIETPTRVDTGGGGAAGAAGAPVAFGAVFAALFGLFGVAVTGRRRA
jgi:hypothetical protein